MYLKELNPEQREAVLVENGPLLILAGAGSGKTRTIIYRIAHLINKGVSPYKLLVMTFTNRAANEMKERAAALLGREIPGMWIGTFHSICLRILQSEATHLGYFHPFSIYNQGHQTTVMRNVIKELNLDPNRYKASALVGAVSAAKNKLHTAEMMLYSADPYERTVGRAYERYQQELIKNKAMDFGDLIMNTVILFQRHPDILANYQEKFSHILIDEYQDTNNAQYQFIRYLTRNNHNICVVGDDDQSIYGWRGADISNILDFEQDYPGVKVIRLEQNYRSTQNILSAANAVIHNNVNRKSKKLWTDKGIGTKLTVYGADNDEDEAFFVLKTIKELNIIKDYTWQDIAILYRTHAQSRSLENAFVYHNMPYRIYGGVRFYDRKEIQDILAYAHVIVNPHDDNHLRRIINVPRRGIGERTMDRLKQYADEKQLSLFDAALEVDKIETVSGVYAQKISEFTQLINHLREFEQNNNVGKVIQEITQASGYDEELNAMKARNSVETETRQENISELINVGYQFNDSNPDEGLQAFLNSIALETEVDNYDEAEDAVTLMTLHSAKGLEFKVVFIVGFEENLFPSIHADTLNEFEELEEERRLCYVGMTRAKEELFISYARSRRQYGDIRYNPPSRFLWEIPEDLYDMLDYSQLEQSEEDYSRVIEADNPYKVGDKVEHDKLGIGLVLEISDNIISVDFLQSGTRKLALEFAPMRHIHDDQISESLEEYIPEEEEKPQQKSRKKQKASFNPGDVLRHSHFGIGMVEDIDGDFITVDFAKAGRKVLSIEHSKFQKVNERK